MHVLSWGAGSCVPMMAFSGRAPLCRECLSELYSELAGFLPGRLFDADLRSRSHQQSPIVKKSLSPVNLLMNIVIGILSIVVFFLLYTFISNSFTDKPVEWTTGSKNDEAPTGEIIQLDVLNGCGQKGVAQRFTDFLRRRNFDVVQSSNYRTFDVEESLVIDRTGDLSIARKVAYALGVDEKNIVQQINPDYYLNVSVVIGRDFSKLKPYE